MSGVETSLKDNVPWPLKIAAKLVLSRLPVSYRLWRRSNLFRHGTMDQPDLAISMLRQILAQAGLKPRIDGLTVLELGPGDALSTGVVAHALGAKRTYLIDAGDFASRDLTLYRSLARRLPAHLLEAPGVEEAPDLDSLLKLVDARYLTCGLQSFASIPAGSVDLAFSNAVLEHVRLKDFLPVMKEFRRVIASSGVITHNVDLRDHLAYGLNNLRFPDRVWEAEWMARSGFYTNRIGYEEMLSLFAEAGFTVEVTRVRKFSSLPVPREQMARRFRSRSDEDLLVSGFSVRLSPA